jgi:hypothetical protein
MLNDKYFFLTNEQIISAVQILTMVDIDISRLF